MKVPILLLSTCVLWLPGSARPAAAPIHGSTTRAALASIENLVEAVRKPEPLSIAQLSRELRFNYDQGECLDTDSHVNYCEYFPKNQARNPGLLGTVALGRNRTTGLIGGSMSWQRTDERTCLSMKDVARVLGQGTRPGVASIPWVPPVQKLSPAAVDELEYNAVPGAGPSVSVRATYQHQCLIELLLDF